MDTWLRRDLRLGGTIRMKVPGGSHFANSLHAVVIGLCALALTACDVWYSFDRIGVSIDSAGDLRIHYVTCEWEQITAVRLTDGNDPGQSDDNEVLWEIQSAAGADGGTFVVGTEPTGFTRTTLVEDERPTDNWFASVRIAEGVGGVITFDRSDLEVDMIWSHGASGREAGNLAPSEFEERARDSCASGR
jgi:hypothetical protein